MIPQFADGARHRFNPQNFSLGITLFSFALLKKVAVADFLSPYVADAFGRIGSLKEKYGL